MPTSLNQIQITHKHHVSVIFQEVTPRDKSFATHRASFSSKYVSNQPEMKLTKVREAFVHTRLNMKIVLQFLHKCYGF